MCGIAGIYSFQKGQSSIAGIARSMAMSLHHRGPDSKGVWSADTVGFGHARLAIVDLSSEGAQPMTSASGRFTICFNGEIYNHQQLRKQLEKSHIELRGNSDTEIFVEGIELYGLEGMLAQSRGMFAFSLWDSLSRSMTLGRDRLGEKPLYYGLIGKDLVFASELKAFRCHPQFKFEIDRQALSAYMKYKYVPTPMCILSGFKKLPAGTLITGTAPPEIFHAAPQAYWVHDVIESGEVGCVSGLEELLLSTIELEMFSDVPTGCFLSGGIDSSLVTSLMQSISDVPVETFTIGFGDREFDESEHAKAVSKHLGTKHTECMISESEILSYLEKLPAIYDEPFADSSQLPTALLSKITSESVTVCLSGDGGDELFCGYDRYRKVDKISSVRRRVPSAVKMLFVQLANRLSEQQLSRIYYKFSALTGRKVINFGEKISLLKNYCILEDESLYDFFISVWKNPSTLVLGGTEVSLVRGAFNSDRTMLENMMMHDARYYLSDDIMVKVDRASMHSSLETRAPLLDHKVYEYAWSMPISEKYRDGVFKYPLRKILNKYVPNSIIDRPKMGFGVPLTSWFGNELREWCGDMLSEERLHSEQYFDVNLVSECWRDHSTGKKNRQYELWNILSFQHWLNHWQNSTIH